MTGWAARGLGEISAERFVLSPQGWLLLDQLSVELSEAEHMAALPGRRIDEASDLIQISSDSFQQN